MACTSSTTLRGRMALVFVPFVLMLNACGNGGNGGASLYALFMQPTLTMDAGQTATITASIVNDSSPGGATFSLSGLGTLGTTISTSMAGQTKNVSLQYTAPTSPTVATIKATSVHSPAQSASIVITINASPAITTLSLPVGTAGGAYSATLTATGGTGTLTWSVVSGALPAGLSLNTGTGTITGTPTTAATSTFTLGVTDAAPVPETAVQTYNVTISPPLPVVTTTTLPNGLVGTPYSQQLAYAGASEAATWTITAGSLPSSSGLTFSSTGLISGMPVAGTYSFSVAATAGGQTSAAVALSITVLAPVAITTTSLPVAHINVAYNQQLTYSGGDPNASPVWAVVSGSLPPTLSLSSGGLLSGTLTSTASYTFGIAVTVGTLTSSTVTYTLSVVSAQITSGTLAYGEVGLPFSYQLTAVGGTLPYTFSLATGSSALPAGLSVNPTTGQITGTPTSNTGSPYTGVVVQVADAAGAVGKQTMTFTVSASRGSSANGELSGQYVFELSGFDSSGNPVTSAGLFAADGAGHITAGTVDTNSTALGAPTANVALTQSSYSIGTDGRGQLTLTTASGNTVYVIVVDALRAGVATGGSLTQFDATGRRLTGKFSLQTTGAFSVASINGGFAFGAYGFAAGSSGTALSRNGVIGEVQFVGTNAVASSEVVLSSSAAPVVPTAGTLTINTNGRGTLSLTLPSSAGTLNFYVYVVSASEMYLMSSDPASGVASPARGLLVGDARVQTIANGGFATSSLNGSSVFYEEKLGSTGAGAYYPDVQVGLYTFDGAGNISGSEDRNAAGAVTQIPALAGTYTVATNGRVTAYVAESALGGCLDCAKPESVFYLAGSGLGYLLDFAKSGGSGSFAPQTASNFTSSSLTGTYALGTQDTLTSSSVPESGALTVGSGEVLTGLLDKSIVGAPTPDVALASTYAVATNGRAALMTGSTNSAVVYLYSDDKGLWLDLSADAPAVRVLTHP